MQESRSTIIDHGGPVHVLGLGRDEIITADPVELDQAAGEAAVDALLIAGQGVEREGDREEDSVVRPPTLHLVIPPPDYEGPVRYFQRPEEAVAAAPVLHVVVASGDVSTFVERALGRSADVPMPEGLILADDDNVCVGIVLAVSVIGDAASIPDALRDWPD